MRKFSIILSICVCILTGAGYVAYRIITDIPAQKYYGSVARSMVGYVTVHEGHFPASWAEFDKWDRERSAGHGGYSQEDLRRIGNLPWLSSVSDLRPGIDAAQKTEFSEERVRSYFNYVFKQYYSL